MCIKFLKFDNKVVRKMLIVGFGAPENAKNHLFHVFGHVRQLPNTVEGAFFTKNKNPLKTHKNGNRRTQIPIFSFRDARTRSKDYVCKKSRFIRKM